MRDARAARGARSAQQRAQRKECAFCSAARARLRAQLDVRARARCYARLMRGAATARALSIRL